MKLYQEILLNTDSYSNPFKLPDGLIKYVFQKISENSTLIIILCALVIGGAFIGLIFSKFYARSSYWILWIAVFTVLAAFCLSVSFEDLGFTIFKTIVPTVAGLTALAILIQNDQKNRREASDRYNEYLKSLHIDRRNRHSNASQKIIEGGELNVINGLQQLAPLAEEWSQDNSVLPQKDIEAQNIANEISETFNRHTKFKNNHPSSIELIIFRIISDLRGADIYRNTSKLKKIKRDFIWKRVEGQVTSTKSHGKTSCIIKRWTRRITAVFFKKLGSVEIYNSINKNSYNFYIKNSEINTQIELPGFNGLEVKKSNFHGPLKIKPRNERVLDAHMINVDFSTSTFNDSVEFYLTKFLHTSNLSPVEGTVFEKSVTFRSCIFIEGSKFQSTEFHKGVSIKESFFFPMVFIEKSKIKYGEFKETRFLEEITIKNTGFETLLFDSCDIKSLFIELIKTHTPNDIPTIHIDNSTISNECTIRGNYDSPKICIENSFFGKKVALGEARNHPLSSVKISNSIYAGLEIYASDSISIKNCKINSINLVVCEDDIEIEINNLKHAGFTCNKTPKRISIYGSAKSIKKLIINDIHTEEIIFRNVHFPKDFEIKLMNIETYISINSECRFADKDAEDKIRYYQMRYNEYQMMKFLC